MVLRLKPMRPGDHAAVLNIWHRGWHDAHASVVPKGILAFRTLSSFAIWLEHSTDKFHVAECEGSVVGFVTTCGSELVKLYVHEDARGTGIARALLSYGEEAIASSGASDATLFCTVGNARAERFYEREGWRLTATFPDNLWLPENGGPEFIVDTHRFEKRLI